MNTNKDNLYYYVSIASFSIGLMLFIASIIWFCNRNDKVNDSSPVEELIIVDSINKTNTKLIIETEILDSVKDVEKDKVLNLNNDSTLRLFYELLRK